MRPLRAEPRIVRHLTARVQRTALFLTLSGLLSCTSRTTSEHYAAALVAGDWAGAHRECAAIEGEPARSDCLVAITERHDRPLADCSEIADPGWAQECAFQFAERAAQAGHLDEAFAACDNTPAFGRECSYHLIRQVADRQLDKPIAEVSDAAAPYASLARAPDAERLFWRAWFRGRLRRDVVIDPTGCPTQACEDAALDEMKTHLPGFRRSRPDFCTADVTTIGETVWAHTALTTQWVSAWRSGPCTTTPGTP